MDAPASHNAHVPHLRVSLPGGEIFRIAEGAGIRMRGDGDKRTLRCPFHDDHNASAFLSVSNVFFCSVCTPGGGWTAKRFAEALGVLWNGRNSTDFAPVVRFVEPSPRREPKFSVAEAKTTWIRSLARARDDEMVERDRDVHDYLARRRLGEALELGAYAVLPSDDLNLVIARWPERGYRLIAPLFDLSGTIVSLQARSIVPVIRKTLNPTGSPVAGTVFADRRGQRLLAGETASHVVFGEGMTDMIALAIASPWPVLSAPGTANAVRAVGAWARGATVLLALDCDEAGNAAVVPVADALYRHGARAVRRVVWDDELNDACAVVEAAGVSALDEFLVGLGTEVRS